MTTMAVNAARIPQGMQFVNSSVIATPAAAAVLAPTSFAIGGFPPSTLGSVQVPVGSAIGAPAMPLTNGQTAVAGASGPGVAGGGAVQGAAQIGGAGVASMVTIGGTLPAATAPPAGIQGTAVAGAAGPGVAPGATIAGGGTAASSQATMGADGCTMPDCPMHAGQTGPTTGGGPDQSAALQQILQSITELISQLTVLLQQQQQPQQLQAAA